MRRQWDSAVFQTGNRLMLERFSGVKTLTGCHLQEIAKIISDTFRSLFSHTK